MDNWRNLLDMLAVAAFAYLTVSVWRMLMNRSRRLPIFRLFAMVIGAQVSIYFAMLALMPDLIDEGEVIGTLLLSLYLTPLFWRIHEDGKQMEIDRERAVVTLSSIGDGVITTDLAGRVLTLNPVAEIYTGWTTSEAVGQQSELVFRIINEESRRPVDSPIRRAMQEGVVVALASNTRLINRGGQEYSIEDSAAPIRNTRGEIIGSVLVFRCVDDKRDVIEKMTWQANHDALTGLPNRTLLSDRIEQTLAMAKRTGQLVVVAFIDLDGFKPVNDQHGHEAGDALLVDVARRLKSALRSEDTVARLGGDEFVLVLSSLAGHDEINPALTRVLDTLSMPYSVNGAMLEISASIGATVYPMDSGDADTLIRHADQAMYQVKQHGRRHFQLFDPWMDQQVRERYAQIERIRQALHQNELLLYYQPKVDMQSEKVVGVEALLRWQHPERGLLGPIDCLPLVAQTATMLEIDRWVLSTALSQVSIWRSTGLNLQVSVNLSERLLQHPDFPVFLQDLLRRHALPGMALELEVLESAALQDLDKVSRAVAACRALGVTIALDDFGTGYSALAYLKRLPADTIKIDRDFVRDMLQDQEDAAIVKAIIGLADTFRKNVVAEGVETPMHAAALRELGCQYAQGYGIARPMPVIEIQPWVNSVTEAGLFN